MDLIRHSFKKCSILCMKVELEEGRVTLYGMSLNPSLCSEVAFDNFDRFVETATGKDTLHDTVGIAYQDISSNLQEILIEPSPSEINNEYLTVSRKRRRTFECGSLDLEPYHKKPKMRFLSFLPLDDSRRNAVPNRLNHVKLLDNLGMLSIFYFPQETPMWVSWNSQIKGNNDTSKNLVYAANRHVSDLKHCSCSNHESSSIYCADGKIGNISYV